LDGSLNEFFGRRRGRSKCRIGRGWVGGGSRGGNGSGLSLDELSLKSGDLVFERLLGGLESGLFLFDVPFL
jgi:hypothetical protein